MLAGSQIDVSDLIEQLVREFKVDINVRYELAPLSRQIFIY
jgi:hypothetical protein